MENTICHVIKFTNAMQIYICVLQLIVVKKFEYFSYYTYFFADNT